MAQTNTDPKSLAKFTITEGGEGFRLHIEDDGGETLELIATADQLDLIAEAVDTLLAKDDSVDEVEDGEDDED